MNKVDVNSKVIDSSNSDAQDLESFLNLVKQSSAHKITDWQKEPTAEALMDDYKKASSAHSFYISKIQGWLDLIYNSSDKRKIKKGRSGISPKVIRRLAEWRYSSLSSSILNEQNLFKVLPTAPEYIDASLQNSVVLNYQFNALIDKVKFVNDLVRTMVNEGTGIIRIGWDAEQQTKEKEVSVYEYVEAPPEQAQMIMQALQQIGAEQQQTGVESATETETFQTMPEDLAESILASQQYKFPVLAVNTGQTQVIQETVDVRNRPSVKVINNADLVIDPTCEGDIDRANFMVYRYETNSSTLRMLEANRPGSYKNLDAALGGLAGDEANNFRQAMETMPNDVFADALARNAVGEEHGFKFADRARKQVTVYEYWGYWDIDNTGIAQSIVATICNGVIIKMERNPFPDGEFPFIVIPYMPVKGSLYGEPDAELISDNQQIIQALTRSIIDINARSANGQTAIPKGFLDAINTQKFRRGEDYEYNPMGAHPAEAIYMHTASEIPQSILAILQNQYAEAESATGVKSFQNGIDGNAYGQVVQGMSQAITAMTQREGDIVYRIAKGLERLGSKVVAMNMEWLNEEEVVAITQDEFIQISKEDLQGDFHLQVHLKSTSESEGKAQQLTFMAQTLGADADWGLRKMMLMEIGQLYNLDTFVASIKDYEPQPDPLQQENAQLENEMLKAKLATEQAQAEYYEARSAFIEAQIGGVEADTDAKALKFLEDKEGVTHARQKEIVESQARTQNEGKLAAEELKGRNALAKAEVDNATKRALGKTKEKGSTSNKDIKPTPQKARQLLGNKGKLPNPEQGIVPDGLFKADGLGNYIAGDSY